MGADAQPRKAISRLYQDNLNSFPSDRDKNVA